MNSSGGSLAGRLPCHEYVTCRFDAGSLGFEMRPLDPATDPKLGHALIVHVVPGGQAEREKLQPFDFVVSVNGEYVAFLSFPAIGDKIRSANRPLTLIVARVWKSAWERIGNDIEAVVKTGNLEKLSVGLLSRWQMRDFVLSRTTLSYSDEGVLRKKVPLEEIVKIVPTTHETEFSITYQGKEVHLKAQSAEDKLMWLHALESTKLGCFDNTVAVLAKVSSAGSTTQGSTSNSSMATPSAAASRPVPAPPINRGPYSLLSKSLVIVRTNTVESGPTYQLPPPVVVPSFPAIDLTLERIVLGRS